MKKILICTMVVGVTPLYVNAMVQPPQIYQEIKQSEDLPTPINLKTHVNSSTETVVAQENNVNDASNLNSVDNSSTETVVAQENTVSDASNLNNGTEANVQDNQKLLMELLSKVQSANLNNNANQVVTGNSNTNNNITMGTINNVLGKVNGLINNSNLSNQGNQVNQSNQSSQVNQGEKSEQKTQSVWNKIVSGVKTVISKTKNKVINTVDVNVSTSVLHLDKKARFFILEDEKANKIKDILSNMYAEANAIRNDKMKKILQSPNVSTLTSINKLCAILYFCQDRVSAWNSSKEDVKSCIESLTKEGINTEILTAYYANLETNLFDYKFTVVDELPINNEVIQQCLVILNEMASLINQADWNIKLVQVSSKITDCITNITDKTIISDRISEMEKGINSLKVDQSYTNQAIVDAIDKKLQSLKQTFKLRSRTADYAIRVNASEEDKSTFIASIEALQNVIILLANKYNGSYTDYAVYIQDIYSNLGECKDILCFTETTKQNIDKFVAWLSTVEAEPVVKNISDASKNIDVLSKQLGGITKEEQKYEQDFKDISQSMINIINGLVQKFNSNSEYAKYCGDIGDIVKKETDTFILNERFISNMDNFIAWLSKIQDSSITSDINIITSNFIELQKKAFVIGINTIQKELSTLAMQYESNNETYVAYFKEVSRNLDEGISSLNLSNVNISNLDALITWLPNVHKDNTIVTNIETVYNELKMLTSRNISSLGETSVEQGNSGQKDLGQINQGSEVVAENNTTTQPQNEVVQNSVSVIPVAEQQGEVQVNSESAPEVANNGTAQTQSEVAQNSVNVTTDVQLPTESVQNAENTGNVTSADVQPAVVQENTVAEAALNSTKSSDQLDNSINNGSSVAEPSVN